MDWITYFRNLENEAQDEHEGVVFVFRQWHDNMTKSMMAFTEAFAFEDVRLKRAEGQGMENIWLVIDAKEPHPGHGLDNVLHVGELTGMFTTHMGYWRMMQIQEQG